MSDLDVAKALASDSAAPYARVHYGTVTEDRQPVYKYDDEGNITGIKGYTAEIRIDGYTGTCTMAVETYVKKRDRVQIVTDPTGRYLVHAMKSEVEQIEDFEAHCMTAIYTDAPIGLRDWETDPNFNTPAPRLYLKYGDGLAVPNESTGNLAVNTGAGLVLSNGAVTLGDHASSATTYGVGTSSNYGHLKISDSITTANVNDTALSLAGANNLNGMISTINTTVSDLNQDVKAARSTAEEAYDLASSHGVCTITYGDAQGTAIPEVTLAKGNGNAHATEAGGYDAGIVVEGSGYALVSAQFFAPQSELVSNGVMTGAIFNSANSLVASGIGLISYKSFSVVIPPLLVEVNNGDTFTHKLEQSAPESGQSGAITGEYFYQMTVECWTS